MKRVIQSSLITVALLFAPALVQAQDSAIPELLENIDPVDGDYLYLLKKNGAQYLDRKLDVKNLRPFPDAAALLKDADDATKKLGFDLGAIGTATERTWTAPNQDLDFTPGTGTYATAAEGDLANTALQNVSGDSNPQLSGQLDQNGQAIGDGVNEILRFEETASAVNDITVKNNATGNAPEIKASGDDANVDIKLVPKGSGQVDVSGNIAVSGTVDGRDVAADGSKLDGIESNATADQTAGEIKTAYESNADTNAYDDAAASKLAGIEAGAKVGDIVGPGSSTDNTVPRFDATSGKALQASGIVVDDSNNISGVADFGFSGFVNGSLSIPGTSGTGQGTLLQYKILPGGASTKIIAGHRTIMETGDTSSHSGGAHGIGALAEFIHSQDSVYPLGLANEAKCNNTGGNALTLCVGYESQLSSNNGTTNFIAYDAQVSSNTGTLNGFTGLRLSTGGNTQTMPDITAIKIEDQDDGTGGITAVNGLVFENQTANAAATKRVVWNKDPAAVIETAGPIHASGITVQTVPSIVTSDLSGSTTVPQDDTVPQNTEGSEFITVAITPKDASNILKIEYEAAFSTTDGGFLVTALFQDSTANALDSKVNYIIANTMETVKGEFEMVAGTTSATTFKLRAGLTAAGTVYMNSLNGGAFLGDSIHSFLKVTERRP